MGKLFTKYDVLALLKEQEGHPASVDSIAQTLGKYPSRIRDCLIRLQALGQAHCIPNEPDTWAYGPPDSVKSLQLVEDAINVSSTEY
jgi:hypothetical protein